MDRDAAALKGRHRVSAVEGGHLIVVHDLVALAVVPDLDADLVHAAAGLSPSQAVSWKPIRATPRGSVKRG